MSHGILDFDVLSLFRPRPIRETARQMRPGDVIPARLEAGFDVLAQLDPQWVWVLDRDGMIDGVLVASPCHGAAMIWRISISKEASGMALARLLRAFLRDTRSRGIRGYLTVVNLGHAAESRLARIITKTGGKVIQSDMTMLASPMPKEGL